MHRLGHWASIVVALGGPLLYVDAMFVHVDAQGALVVLMIPVVQMRMTAMLTADVDDVDRVEGAMRGAQSLA